MQMVRQSSSGGVDTPSPHCLSLPPALVKKATERLCFITVFCAVMTVLLLGMQMLLQPEFTKALWLPSIQLTVAGTLLMSLGFLLIQTRGWVTRERLLDFAVPFQVLIAFSISMFETSMEMHPEVPVLGHSGVAIWLAMCGLLLPNAPIKSGIAAALSVASWPLAYWIHLSLQGYPPLPWNRLLVWNLPNLLMAVWMYFFNLRQFRDQWKQVKAEELGSYKLDYLIGKGGMGEVWRARHSMLARDAAVKLIRSDVTSAMTTRDEELVRKRFEREAQATASLRSPHTVALYDFGRTKDNTFYYVMELLDGLDLQTIVSMYGPMPAGRVRKVLLGIADSLREAHSRGMVHRDIKPKNIVLAKLGLRYDFPKVLDFGLVKIRMDNPDAMQMTMDGTATGTPAYLAPEIALGKSDVDGRADLYALGCVAYFLLTGELVFDAPTPTAMALAHVQQTPVRPSQRTGHAIPAELEDLVMGLLEKDPRQRIGCAKELVRRLEAMTDFPDWSEADASNWWQEHLPEKGDAPRTPTPAVELSDDMPTSAIVIGPIQ